MRRICFFLLPQSLFLSYSRLVFERNTSDKSTVTSPFSLRLYTILRGGDSITLYYLKNVVANMSN